VSVLVDASSQFVGDPTNAQPHTFVGPTISAPAGALVLVYASCNSASGHPTSTIDVTAVSGGHTATKLRRLSQADGGGSQNAPIGVWAFAANGSAFAVTQQDTSAGFAMSQAVFVITGADTSNIAGMTTAIFASAAGTPTMSGTAAQNGSLIVCGVNDWANTQDLPVGATGMTTDLAIQGSADAIPTYYGHKAVNAGAWSVGTTALAHQGGTNGIAVQVEPAAAAFTLTPTVISLVAQSFALTPGMVTVNLNPTSIALTPVALGLTPGMATLNLTPVVFRLSPNSFFGNPPGRLTPSISPAALIASTPASLLTATTFP
jgi:hypothetical protein